MMLGMSRSLTNRSMGDSGELKLHNGRTSGPGVATVINDIDESSKSILKSSSQSSNSCPRPLCQI